MQASVGGCGRTNRGRLGLATFDLKQGRRPTVQAHFGKERGGKVQQRRQIAIRRRLQAVAPKGQANGHGVGCRSALDRIVAKLSLRISQQIDPRVELD